MAIKRSSLSHCRRSHCNASTNSKNSSTSTSANIDLLKYMDELFAEMNYLNMLRENDSQMLRQASSVLAMEIQRVWQAVSYEKFVLSIRKSKKEDSSQIRKIINAASELKKPNVVSPAKRVNMKGDSGNSKVRLEIKIPIPATNEYTRCNFIGRILGPRGMSAKQIENETGCTILIRGEGSVKDPSRESRLRGLPGWEHLVERLHVLISAVGNNYAEAHKKLDIGARTVMQLLKPVNDDYKKRQLVQLAIINGTYRPNEAAA